MRICFKLLSAFSSNCLWKSWGERKKIVSGDKRERERESVNFHHMNARTGRAFWLMPVQGKKEEKLFAQLVYWQIQFPDQRWTVADGRSMLSILCRYTRSVLWRIWESHDIHTPTVFLWIFKPRSFLFVQSLRAHGGNCSRQYSQFMTERDYPMPISVIR